MRRLTKDKEGLILIISLWILAIISLLCISLAHRVIINLKLVKFQRDKVKCLYIAKAAIQKAVSVLKNDLTTETDTLGDLWSNGYDKTSGSYIFKDVGVGDGVFTVSYIFNEANIGALPVYFYGACDEDRKVNINEAPRELLVSLFAVLGFDNPETLAENIIYWRGDAPQGYEDGYYGSPEAPYPARKAPLKSIEELSLVKGFRNDPQLLKKCEIFFTVYTKDNIININTAPRQILKAVFMSLGSDSVNPELSDRLANNIIDFRDGADDQETTNDDLAIYQGDIVQILETGFNPGSPEQMWISARSFPFTVKSNLFRIDVSVKLNSSSIQKKVATVIDRGIGPFEIRYWHEE